MAMVMMTIDAGLQASLSEIKVGEMRRFLLQCSIKQPLVVCLFSPFWFS